MSLPLFGGGPLDLRPESRGAVIEGPYRYLLWRCWSRNPPLGWVMLNPSTADGQVDDPTVRRCIGFAKREGAGGILVANLWAWRARFPFELRGVGDPVGPRNDDHVRLVGASCRRVICAWGALGWGRDRVAQVVPLLEAETLALGYTKEGDPRHPLMVRADAELLAFPRDQDQRAGIPSSRRAPQSGQ